MTTVRGAQQSACAPRRIRSAPRRRRASRSGRSPTGQESTDAQQPGHAVVLISTATAERHLSEGDTGRTTARFQASSPGRHQPAPEPADRRPPAPHPLQSRPFAPRRPPRPHRSHSPRPQHLRPGERETSQPSPRQPPRHDPHLHSSARPPPRSPTAQAQPPPSRRRDAPATATIGRTRRQRTTTAKRTTSAPRTATAMPLAMAEKVEWHRAARSRADYARPC